MLVRLDPGADTPIYLQIAESVAAHIDAGRVRSGERLPSARSLAKSLGVNMHTVLKAYSELEGRGLVEMRRGRAGVVVTEGADPRVFARQLVSLARRQGMKRADVVHLIEEVWR
jgi:GntR family transcriptional regulator